MTCQGQVRFAPSGQVIGLELEVALQVAAARCYDVTVLSELLSAAEAGTIEAVISDSQASG